MRKTSTCWVRGGGGPSAYRSMQQHRGFPLEGTAETAGAHLPLHRRRGGRRGHASEKYRSLRAVRSVAKRSGGRRKHRYVDNLDGNCGGRLAWFAGVGASVQSCSDFPCPNCGREMMITRIMPDRPGFEQRTYECTMCGDETVLMVASAVRPAASVGHSSIALLLTADSQDER
jgi:predicted RNA-binding Zn-ribbon protein involved in translation (DUF1610 family)